LFTTQSTELQIQLQFNQTIRYDQSSAIMLRRALALPHWVLVNVSRMRTRVAGEANDAALTVTVYAMLISASTCDLTRASLASDIALSMRELKPIPFSMV
jgi:hypothetical protein